MTVAVLPDVERLVVDWLLDQNEITSLTGRSIWTVLPKQLRFPCVLVTRQGGGGPLFDSYPLVAEETRLQVDAYADTKNEAWLIAATVQALAPRLVGDHPEGGVRKASSDGPQWLPDEGLGFKPRYLFDLLITTKLPSPAA